MESGFPVGTVLVYSGGADSNTLESLGWLVCDGSLLNDGSYPELFAVIGDMYGGDDSHWALPDYRGRFLRGLDAGRGLDPDAATRGSANSSYPKQGNFGDTVGSTQGHTFRAHTHIYSRHEGKSPGIQGGTGKHSNCIRHNEYSYTSDTAGGATESRPVNIAVRFLIKCQDGGSVPVASVVAYGHNFPGPASPSGWLGCDGALQQAADQPDLWAALGTTCGGSGSELALPDYRGVFLRGVDGGAAVDPDASARTAPRPDLDVPGASGDHACSFQACALADHSHTYSKYNDEQRVMRETQNDLVKRNEWQGSSGETGGSETRPVNAYVGFLIAIDSRSTQAPIGAITAYAGDDPGALSDLGWIWCDGRLLQQSDYPELFAVLGVAYGGDGETGFAVPDLRGAFVRGVDGGSGRDPDVDDRSSPRPDLAVAGASRDNAGSWQADELQSHQHGYSEWEDDINSDNGVVDPVVLDDKYTRNFDDTGGAETRPTNTAVHWIIRAT